MLPSRDIARLIEIMAALRTPGSGCPWDLAQDFRSILPYTIEEAFEVADAIERDDRHDLREELGDLLLQVVFHARMAEEDGAFDFGGVVEAITTKLIRRHPHVFGDTRHLTPAGVKALWDSIKMQEKAERASRNGGQAAPYLADIPASFPPVLRAHKLQAKAAKVGFDWTDMADVVAKVREELAEAEAAIAAGDAAAQEDEIGDLLFAVVNLARKSGIDPEAALRGTNAKFVRRFGAIEAGLRTQDRTLDEATLEEMDALWTAAKATERESARDPG